MTIDYLILHDESESFNQLHVLNLLDIIVEKGKAQKFY